MSWTEIVGYQLIDNHTGKSVGTITAVDDSTINTLFNTRTDDGKETLVPAAEQLIESVDTEKKEIKINLPEGILDLD